MLKTLISIGSLACVLSVSSLGRAQAIPTATANGRFQVGAGYSIAMPDYAQQNIGGASAFADFDFGQHLGVEADVHYIAFHTPTDIAEDTYLVGPRVLINRGRFTPYVKVLGGIGSLVIQETQDNPGKYSGTYFAYAIGGGLDVQVTQHIVVRVIDAEVQKWPSLGNGLSPYVYTAGLAWRFR